MPDGSNSAPAARTRLSTKGQVVLPKAVRNRLGWRPGREIEVVETPDGVLLRAGPTVGLLAVPPVRPTTIEEVAGCLKYDGPPVSIREMDEAVDEMFRGEWGRQFDPR